MNRTLLPGSLSTPADRFPRLTVVLFLIGIVIRLAGANVVTHDMRTFLLPWYRFIATHDWASALRGDYANYTPPYLYLLTLVARSNRLVPPMAAIKLLSVLFDFANAFLVYRIVGQRGDGQALPLLAAALFLCLPTPAMNSAAWGQTDAVYTCFVLAGLYFLLVGRPAPCMVFFGIALGFKAQALLLAPFVLVLTIKRRIPWWTWVLVPAAYLLLMFPTLLAGRSLGGVLGVYLGQAQEYRQLSMHAPNLYLVGYLLPGTAYRPGLVIGFAVAAVAATVWVVACARRLMKTTPAALVLCAAVCAAMMPFLLPKMHDRFFYLADVLTFLLVFFLPQLWGFAVAFQVSSGLAYLAYLFVPTALSPTSPGALLLVLGALVNTAAVCRLVRCQWRIMTRRAGGPAELTGAPTR